MDAERWVQLAAAQEGMISWAQLHGLGISRSFVRSQLRAGRWQQITRRVFCTTTGPLSRSQQLWLGVLHPGGDALIGGLTALKIAGLRGWDREDITVMVHNADSYDPVPGFDFFRSRRRLPDSAAEVICPCAAWSRLPWSSPAMNATNARLMGSLRRAYNSV